FQAGARVMLIGGSANEGPPMTIQRSFGLASFPGNPNSTPPSGSLLPGGTAGLEVQGFAVSAGTREPMLAYELAKFLTNSAEVATQLFGSTPARRSLVGMEPESTGERSGPGRGFRLASLNFSPEAQAVIDQGFEHALPARELFFVDYISRAFSLMQDEDLDAQSALQQVEAEAVANLNHAADLRPEIVISVATPAPEVALAPGEIALNFGAASFISPLPNQDRWQQIIDQFVASDPEIGQINLNTDLNLDLDSMAEQNDCFYLPTNAVSSGSLSSVISLDPFMDADPQFDQADLIGGVMQQVRFDNRTWAYPLAIQPEVLRYNPDLFTRAGVPLPDQGWTTTQFVDALHALKSTPDDPAPFIPRDFTGQYLYALITAFGGVPIDNRTNPPTIDFTDPATVDAIRQVLDLAKDGYIDYTELGQGGGVNISLAVGSEEDTDPLYTHTLGAFSFFTRLNREGQTATDRYRYITYPRGSQHTPISFDLSTAYISTNAANPDACYRWIRELAQHADLFSAMPVQRSLIDDPSTAPELAGLYHQIDTILSDPATIISPSVLRTGGGSIWMQFWLRRAFDRYVLEDADLDAELAEAEQFTRDYAQCAAEIPPTNPTTPEDQLAYFQQFGACAHQVDPTAG
ncbi:MAG: extracellular solute-binding protein, partial [Anaerolineae bacterium]|nr:extracellular solute-binding protein [Anaerolineae bacterium]